LLSRLPAAKRAALVGVVPQDIYTPMAYTVEEIVAMGRNYTRSRWSVPHKRDAGIIEEAMRTADVESLRRRSFSELSGGERQRVIIAMVLAQSPDLIIMDEATAHLDLNHRLEIMELVEKLNREQERTILMVSHDLNLAAEFFPRLILLNDGRLVADGSPADVLTEEKIFEVYGCRVAVESNPHSGAVMVVAKRSDMQRE